MARTVQLLRHDAYCPIISYDYYYYYSISPTDLVSVFDAILTSRQAREKLQCLYENNFRKTAVLKFRITRLSARKSEQMKYFQGIKICLYLLFKY